MEISNTLLSTGQNYNNMENSFESKQLDTKENINFSSPVQKQEEFLTINQNEENSFSEDYLESQIDEMNKGMEAFNTSLHFKLHKETGIMMIRFIDKKTNEIVKEYPPEEFLDKKARIREFIGIILDEKA